MRQVLIGYFFIVLLITSSSSQTGWFHQSSGTSASLYDVFFLNENTGFIAGSLGRILKTTNSGQNWVLINTGSNENITSVHALSMQVIFASHRNQNTSQTQILKSINGGVNWNAVTIANSRYVLNEIYFIDNMHGFIGGDGRIFYTSNGGDTWFEASLNWYMNIHRFNFFNSTTGYATGNASLCSYLKTTNGGESWNKVGTLDIKNGYFINENMGWLVGKLDFSNYYCGVATTTNAGSTFAYYDTNSIRTGSYILNQTKGFIWGTSGLKVSSNGGETFQFVDSVNFVEDLFFINNLTGWAVGNNGSIYKTTNGGTPIGIAQISLEVPKEFVLGQNYPNPFNPETYIEFDIMKREHVELTIYDALGKEIARLVNQELEAGRYRSNWNAINYPSGIYFYSIKTNENSMTRKMVLSK